MNFLKGKKTAICAIVGGIAYALETMGIIDAEIFKWIMAFVGPAGLMALRAGVEKSGK